MMSEKLLVENFINSNIPFLWTTQNKVDYLTEVKITSNRVDVVFFERKGHNGIGFMTAIEAKLTDWKCALRQAHRDTLFADTVYVVLPRSNSSAAISNISEFRKAKIGLMTVDDSGVKAHYHPPLNKRRSVQHVERAMKVLTAH